MRGYQLLFGYEDLEISEKHMACFLNLCRREGFVYRQFPGKAGEKPRVRCLLSVAGALHRACEQRGIEVHVLRRGGLPVVFYRYRRRVGLLLGALVGAFLLWLASGVVWDIRVEGNKTLSEESVLEALADCGLQLGTRLAKTDSREVENRMLRHSEEIAWISVNIKGTVAHVQIREMQEAESAVGEETVNLVAAYDGVIESVKLLSGQVVVSPGQLVRAGELLISGVRDSDTQGYRVIGARGEVMARTEHTSIIQIPLQIEEKSYTGIEKCEKSLFFFGKSIKVSKNTGIIGGSCDTIYTRKNWTLPTGLTLPLATEQTVYREYVLQTVERTEQEAYDLAMAQLDALLKENAADALLLSKTTQVSYSDTHCILVCDYSCLRNIAQPRALEVAQ